MKRLLNTLIPKTITSQLLAILVVVLIIAQVANLFIIIGERRIQARANIFSAATDNVIRKVQQLPAERPHHLPFRLHSERRSRGRFTLSDNSLVARNTEATKLSSYSNNIKTSLDENDIQYNSIAVALIQRHQIRHERPPLPFEHKQIRKNLQGNLNKAPRFKHDENKKPPTLQAFLISIELEPDLWLNAIIPHYSIEALTPRILKATAILLLLTLLTAWFFIKRISRPLSELTVAAQRFGRGESAIILKEKGPQDIQLASKAFNSMQRNLSRMLESQRTMLRAVGHDLRTPLTSLRLRSELMEDETEKKKFIASIDDMTLMTEEILNWAKNTSGLEQASSIDLFAFLSNIVDDYADQNHDVQLKEFDKVSIKIRRAAMKRAIENIVSNALKYGERAHLSVTQTPETINIHFDDNGPGIDENLIDEALKPFVRIEASRNKKTGGTGLGLSIAETIVQTEGGKLLLTNQKSGGLRVTFVLPKQ